MRTLTQTDLKDLKSKNIKVIRKGRETGKAETKDSQNLLADMHEKVLASAKHTALQINRVIEVLTKISGFIEAISLVNKQQSVDREAQTQKIISKLDEKKDVKKWRFNVVRNNRGFITDVIASEIKE